jgi:hypothetical protein
MVHPMALTASRSAHSKYLSNTAKEAVKTRTWNGKLMKPDTSKVLLGWKLNMFQMNKALQF